jgi:hypothetical protein
MDLKNMQNLNNKIQESKPFDSKKGVNAINFIMCLILLPVGMIPVKRAIHKFLNINKFEQEFNLFPLNHSQNLHLQKKKLKHLLQLP